MPDVLLAVACAVAGAVAGVVATAWFDARRQRRSSAASVIADLAALRAGMENVTRQASELADTVTESQAAWVADVRELVSRLAHLEGAVGAIYHTLKGEYWSPP